MTADPAATPQAEKLVSKMGVSATIVSPEEAIPERRTVRPTCVLYLAGKEPLHTVQASLAKVAVTDQNIVFYVASHPDAKTVFEWGALCQRLLPGRHCGIVSSLEELNTLLAENTASEALDAVKPALTIETLRRAFGLTQAQLAKVAEVTTRTIQNWERQGLPVSSSRSLTDLAELRDILVDHVEPNAIHEWLNTPNEKLGNKTPFKVLEQGHTRDVLWQLRSVATGEPA
jgi:DNA-binding XRE family transcriptional regulator